MYIVRITLFACHLLSSMIAMGGCISETLVTTPEQLTRVAALKAQDLVLCRTRERTIVTRPVDMIRHRRVDEVIHITIGNDELDVAVDQLFLLANESRYITADQLTVNDRLMNIHGDLVIIDRIERRYGSYSLIALSVNEHHTFFVTKQGIVLHNNTILGFFTTSDSWESSTKVALTSAAGIIAIPAGIPTVCTVIAGGCIYYAKDHIISACKAIGRGLAWLFGISLSPGDEARKLLEQRKSVNCALHEIALMADPAPNNDNTYRVYEPSPKHYPTPRRNASPGPGWIVGQMSLNFSWEVITDSGASETRVAYCGGRIVIFMFTQQIFRLKIYHGYYQDEDTISSLDIDIRKVLRKNQIINHRDKIIK
jgi:hypothetical protein